jgi:hypothetical protein
MWASSQRSSFVVEFAFAVVVCILCVIALIGSEYSVTGGKMGPITPLTSPSPFGE